MKIRMKDYKSQWVAYQHYGVIVDDNEIETIVTNDPSTVKAWINNIEHIHHYRLHRLIVGLDIEWRPNMTSNCDHSVATLQLCVGQSCLIFQLLHTPRIPHRLRKFLEDPDYTFVGVGIKNDVKKLWEDCGLEVSKMRDLRHWAAKELDREDLRRAGMSALVREVLGEKISKPENVRLSMWDKRHLTNAQVLYACLDAYFSFEIGRVLSSWY